ncbi:hypothetical protein ALC53_02590 [Atta colombica]|uniref:Uncharacterized protein n=1 Tax=Atta colombica TaxID=520822 RepID=A0A195BS32_9HYME|nr:hypothetical protein ALC53_02590 [Atta colombica]
MLTMSTLMMPTTMTTMTNPGPIPAHSVPQKMEPPKLTAAATLTHTPTPANKSVGLPYPKCYNNLTEDSLDNLDRDLLIEEHRIHRRRCKRLQEERSREERRKDIEDELPLVKEYCWRIILLI